jgi:hypothetical protein
MADLEGGYQKALSDGEGAQHGTSGSGRWFHVVAALLGGSCLVLLLVGAFHSSNPAEPTSLFAMRAPASTMKKALNLPISPISPFPASVNNMRTQTTFFRPGLQPNGLNLPYQRPGNIPPLKGFWDNIGRDAAYYDRKSYQSGEEAEYRSSKGWIKCVVSSVRDGAIQLDVKPGYWLDEKEQGLKMRKKTVNKGQPRLDRILI